ncbi:MAG: phosphatase PAP2 family protein [Arsenophonus sp.]|nr:MAG: phosphatase PAP2 family protein [Arsenophonus sp.]
MFDLIKQINIKIFYFINANEQTSKFLITIFIFFASKLIFLLPILGIFFFIFEKKMLSLRKKKFIFQLFFSILLGLIISSLIRFYYPTQRPFDSELNVYSIYHISSSSFPSNHALISYILTWNFFNINKNMGIFFFIITNLIGISRIFLGLHWPIDIVGSLFLSIFVFFLVNYFFKSIKKFFLKY